MLITSTCESKLGNLNLPSQEKIDVPSIFFFIQTMEKRRMETEEASLFKGR